MIPASFFLVFAAILFVIGLYGILTTKRALVSLMSVELMLNSANINFITFAAYGMGNHAVGQVFVIMTIAIAAAEVAVGIALVLNAYKRMGTTETTELITMRW